MGVYPESEIKIQDRIGYRWDKPDEDLVFTISLGEPFNDRCYKLVAGVTALPSGPALPTAQSDAASTRDDDILVALAQHGLTIVDMRTKNGCLWVVGGPELGDLLRKIAPEREFKFAEHGGRATGHRPAWFLI
jgi:hypothetical protein